MLKRASIFASVILALAAFAPIMPAGAAASPRPVVVELFTSQGCADCPAADEIIVDLAKRNDVIALTLPITYWDMLGWKDTFATAENTKRQNAYAKAMKRAGVFTPQIVMDGIVEVVGNRRDLVMSALAERMKVQPRHQSVDLNIDLSQGRLAISIGAAKAKEKPLATVWVMHTLARGTVDVRLGENKDRTLSYVNVVRELRRAGEWSGQAMKLDLPLEQTPTNEEGIAVILQSREHGEVLGAAALGAANHE